MVQRQLSTWKEQESGPDRGPATHHALHGSVPETDWNVDWRSIGLRTRARRNFSHSLVVCNSSKTKQKGGGHQGVAATRLLKKYIKMNVKTSFFYVMLEAKKILNTFPGVGNFFFNKIHKNFVCNLTSKLVRSTWYN
jgi:hypothetical protein